MTTGAWSYTSGTSDVPLLGLTIGDMFDQHRRPLSRQRGARLPPPEPALHLPPAPARGRPLRAGPDRARRREGPARRHLGAELRGVDDHPVRDRQARRDPREHQPELPAQRGAVRAAAVRLRVAGDRAAVQDLRLHRDDPRADARAARRAGPARWRPPPSRTCAAWCGSARTPSPGMLAWGELLAMAERVGADELARRQRQQEFDDPINIQYTSGTTGYPKGATLSHHNILNNGYFITELLRFTDRDRLLIPVPLYHCFGMVMGNLGCVTHGATMIYPSDGFDADGRAGGRAGRAGHRALRRADHVHRRAEPSRLRALRPVERCAPASWPARRARSR